MKKLFSITFLFRVFYVLNGFLISILLTKILSIQDYGHYTYLMTIVTLFAVLLQFGWPHILMRESALAFVHKNWSAIKPLLYQANFMALKIFSIVAVLAAALFYTFKSHASYSLSMVLLSGMLSLTLTLSVFRSALLKGSKNILAAQLGESVLRPCFFTLICVLILFFNALANYENLLLIYALCSLLAFITIFIFCHYKQPRFNQIHDQINIKKESIFSFALTNFLQILSTYSGILCVGLLLGAEHVAVLRVATLFATMIAIFIQIVEIVVTPKVSDLVATNKKNELMVFLKKLMFILFFLSIAIVIVYVLFAKEIIIYFYGEGYIKVYSPLLILSIGQLVNVSTGPVGLLMVLLKQEKFILRVMLIAMLLNFFLQFLLIGFFEVSGSAIASASALAAFNLLLLYQTRTLLIKSI